MNDTPRNRTVAPPLADVHPAVAAEAAAAARRRIVDRLTGTTAVVHAEVVLDRDPLAVRGILADGRTFVFTVFGGLASLVTTVSGATGRVASPVETACPPEMELSTPDLVVTVLLDLLSFGLQRHRLPTAQVKLTFQQAAGPKLDTPFPYTVHPDGAIAYQEFWNGEPAWLLGFRRPGETGLALAVHQWWFTPEAALGLEPVFRSAGKGDEAGGMYAITLPVVSVTVPRVTENGSPVTYDHPYLENRAAEDTGTAEAGAGVENADPVDTRAEPVSTTSSAAEPVGGGSQSAGSGTD